MSSDSCFKEAADRLAALHEFAGQVEDGEREGDMAALLAASAIATSNLAIAEAIRVAGGIVVPQ